ncbi:MAG: ABC transporter permease [Acidimicrobiales bacterium]
MTELTATGTLTRAILHRDGVRIAVWALAIAGLVVLTAASVKGLYPTQADLDEAAATEDSAAAIALNGPPHGLDTVGGQVAFQIGAWGMVAVGLMSLLLMTRNTRGEEESGRLDLVRATVVGRHAPPAAALVVVGGVNVLVGAAVAFANVGYGLPTAGSLLFGAGFTIFGFVFAGVAAVTSQVTDNTRVASGLAGAVLGASYAIRAAGDVGDGTLSWFSPIGLVQKSRPYAGDVWWPLLIALAVAAALAVLAAVLASHRDIGAGLVPPRPGPPKAGALLAGPMGLAVRLQRGTLLAWTVGLFLTGAAYGSIADQIGDFADDSEAMEEIIAQAGGGSLTDSFYATTVLMMALISTGYAIQSALRLRSEEIADRIEPLLATPTSRERWSASHLATAVVGSLVVLAAGGLGAGLLAGIVTDDLGELPRLVGSALAYAPAVWLLVGLAVVLFGWVPRAALAAWAGLAFCFVVGVFGQLLDLPAWLVDVSPFQRVPQLPVADLDLVPLLVMTVVAAALTSVGVAGFRRRDVG